MMRLLLLVAACWAGSLAAECGECDPSQCALATDCYAGVVMDLCNCCAVCGKREGEECDDPEQNIRENLRGDGRCGENLECKVVRTNQKKGKKVRKREGRAGCLLRYSSMPRGHFSRPIKM